MNTSLPRLAIIGPGLLGGSIGLAAKGNYDVRFWGRNEIKLQPVKADGFFASTDLASVIEGAQLIILAIPVPYMALTAQQLIRSGLKPDQLVTDVGSVKGAVLKDLTPLLIRQGFSFIGSHPMAGSEGAGYGAAQADLLQGASCIITPDPLSKEKQLEFLHEFWQSLGMNTYELNAVRHDDIISKVSHIPHILAAVCAHTALQNPADGAYAGGGLRDTSRIASGNPDLWTGILMENKTAILENIDSAITRLSAYKKALSLDDDSHLRKLLSDDKNSRDHSSLIP